MAKSDACANAGEGAGCEEETGHRFADAPLLDGSRDRKSCKAG
jgi:hypothetical protein